MSVKKIGRDELERYFCLTHLSLSEELIEDQGDPVIVDHRIARKRELHPVEYLGELFDMLIDLGFFHSYGNTGTDDPSHACPDDLCGMQRCFFKIMQDAQVRYAKRASSGKDQREVVLSQFFYHGSIIPKSQNRISVISHSKLKYTNVPIKGTTMSNIVITGCSTGIGLETARYLKERYITVYPTARKPEDVEMLRSLGFENAMQLDVTRPEQIERVIAEVLAREGSIDVWFNNAGYGQPGAIEDIRTEVLREQFETNLFDLHECTRQIIPVMKKQGYGKIIQYSSVLGLISLFGRGAYNASKYAIEGLTDTLRLELSGTNIHAVLLNTGPITSHFRETAMQKLRQNVDIEHSDLQGKIPAESAGKEE